MQIEHVYEKIKKIEPKRVVLQFTNEYLSHAKSIEEQFSAKLPEVKFYISADKFTNKHEK